MALNANTVSGKQSTFVPLEAGSYPARLVGVIDLGLQAQPDFKGQKKEPARMLALTYELSDEFMADEDGEPNPERPRWITEQIKFYNLTADKAISTQRYKTLDPNETHGGDWVALLGSPVLLSIVQNPSKGRIYENVAGISAMRAKDAAKLPELVNETISFDLDQPDPEVWKRVPKFLQEKIKANLEYAGSALEKLLGGTTAAKPEQKGKTNLKVVSNTEEESDDIPY